jgi:DNA-binding response OmpR family regulator
MGTKGTILIVDDEPAIRQFLEMALVDEGYDTLIAPNGAEALELLQKQSAQLILLDLGMPVMDGRAFLQRYWQRTVPHVPVIVLSARTGVLESTLLERIANALPKPFDIVDLLAYIEKYLRDTVG